MSQSASDQLTAIYLQLAQINSIVSNLATLSSVNTKQVALQTLLNTIYSNIKTLSSQVNTLDMTVSSILVSLRSS